MRLRIGHSPDPDDAFMAWALAEGIVRDPAFEVELLPRDVQTLNQWAVEGRGLDVTALSVAAFARVTDDYLLLPFGASFGEGYGPVVVASQELTPEDLHFVRIAAPGALTTAATALRMALGDGAPSLEHVPFDDILPGVKHGLFEAGLLIHEGQITYEREGLVKVLDLAAWWESVEPGLPLPLGVVAIRRDIGEDLLPRAVALVKRALDAALENREAALAYASKFGRGLPPEDVDRFVGMYVTKLTHDMRPRGARAVERFLARMTDARLVDHAPRVEFAPDPEHPNPRTLALVEERAEPVQADDPAIVAAALIPTPLVGGGDDGAAADAAPPAPRVRKSSAARKAVAPKATRKSAAKRGTAKKAAAKKAAPKGATSKKSATKKGTAKKATKKPAKKAAAKKATRSASAKGSSSRTPAVKKATKQATKKPTGKASAKKASSRKGARRRGGS